MTSPLAKESARRHPDSPLIQEGPIDLTCFFPISLKRPSRTGVEVKLLCLFKSHFAQIVNVLLRLFHLFRDEVKAIICLCWERLFYA